LTVSISVPAAHYGIEQARVCKAVRRHPWRQRLGIYSAIKKINALRRDSPLTYRLPSGKKLPTVTKPFCYGDSKSKSLYAKERANVTSR
jgi:hypothetical protein